MIDSVDEEQIEGIKNVLQNLKTLVFLHNEGYKLKNDTYFIGDYDEYYSIEEGMLEEIITSVCGENTWESNHATQERGDRLGYDMIYTEDEITITEILIKAPELVKYLDWLKECELRLIDCNDFYHKISRLLIPRSWGDYEVHESFIASDYSGIVLLLSDYEGIDTDFASKLIDVMEYCKRQLKRKEEGEKMYEQLSA